MIILENPSLTPHSYDQTYGANAEHFTQKSADEALENAFAEIFKAPVTSAMDVGCGQVYLVESVFERAKSYGETDRAIFFDLDASGVAIRQAELRPPQHSWLHHLFEGYLERRHDVKVLPNDGFDLITVKSGLTFIKEEGVYKETMEGIPDLLRDGGYYLYQHQGC